MPGTPRSACGGKVQVDGVDMNHVRRWELNWSKASKRYSSSSTACVKQSVEGAEDGTVTIGLYIDDTLPFHSQIAPGDSKTLKLYEDATRFWTVPVYCESIGVPAEIENDELLNAVVNCSINGAVTPP